LFSATRETASAAVTDKFFNDFSLGLVEILQQENFFEDLVGQDFFSGGIAIHVGGGDDEPFAYKEHAKAPGWRPITGEFSSWR
jgi:hypothetical protein